MTDMAWLRRIRLATLAAGLVALLAATVWWWLVYRQLLLANYISVPRALPCMATQSPLCRLAQALCASDHFLGIKRYSTVLFWIGSALVLTGMTATVLQRVRQAPFGGRETV